ncbi:MAG: hypothetical protein AB7E46_14515 [Desulfovibrio sp.]
MRKAFDFIGFCKAVKQISRAYLGDQNWGGVKVGGISDCEFEFLLMMDGKWVNVIEMLTKHLGETQKTYYTASSDKAHLHLFWAMVEDLHYEELVIFLAVSGYCKRFAMIRDDIHKAMQATGRPN